MRTVYKYALPEPGVDAAYEMGGEIQPVLVGNDPNGVPCVWFDQMLTPKAQRIRVFLAGTGHPVPDFVHHAGSFVADMFVWHVYYTRIN